MMRELIKRWRFRISGGLLIAAIIVLLDEIIKEGYTFDLLDLFNFTLTHEKIFIILLVGGIVLGFKSHKFKWRGGKVINNGKV
ncbi:MAG: hypothetical protein QXH53_06400 [Nitrososphaerales archaeon]